MRRWLMASGLALAAFAVAGRGRGDAPPPGLTVVAAPLGDWLAARPHAPADGGADPSDVPPAVAAAFGEALDALAEGRWLDAQAAAAAAGYEAFAIVDGERWYAALAEAGGAGVGPTVVLAPAASRDVVVEAPHSASEAGTARQAADALFRLGARAVILEGAHRCASSEPSGCDGTTAVCAGVSAPFRASDVAHARASLFELAHEALATRWPAALIVQVHRMRPDPTRLVAADGSGEARPGDATLPARVRDRVRAALGEGDVGAVSCHDPVDESWPYPPLCATTNVQGRWLDGSADACSEPGGGASGRFLHLEQGPALLDADPPAGVVVDALVAELPCFAPGAEGCPPGPPDAGPAAGDPPGIALPPVPPGASPPAAPSVGGGCAIAW